MLLFAAPLPCQRAIAADTRARAFYALRRCMHSLFALLRYAAP